MSKCVSGAAAGLGVAHAHSLDRGSLPATSGNGRAHKHILQVPSRPAKARSDMHSSFQYRTFSVYSSVRPPSRARWVAWQVVCGSRSITVACPPHTHAHLPLHPQLPIRCLRRLACRCIHTQHQPDRAAMHSRKSNNSRPVTGCKPMCEPHLSHPSVCPAPP